MAGLAQPHYIAEVVGSSAREREDVVGFLRWGESAFFLALLA